MQAMSNYRRWQFRAMVQHPQSIEHLVASITDPAAFDRRDGDDGWTISEVLGHLKDVDSYFFARARALAENNEPPASSGKDPDTMVKERAYAEQNALDLLEQWKQVSGPYQEFMASLPEDDEALWERPGRDADGGGFTLNDQLMLSAYHHCDHLHQIVKIIRG